MYYAIMGRDRPESLELRLSLRQQHLERIQALVDAGRVLTAGPHPQIDAEDPGPAGFSGSLIIAEFASLEEARNWAEGDVYNTGGLFEHLDVKPFKPVLP